MYAFSGNAMSRISPMCIFCNKADNVTLITSLENPRPMCELCGKPPVVPGVVCHVTVQFINKEATIMRSYLVDIPRAVSDSVWCSVSTYRITQPASRFDSMLVPNNEYYVYMRALQHLGCESMLFVFFFWRVHFFFAEFCIDVPNSVTIRPLTDMAYPVGLSTNVMRIGTDANVDMRMLITICART